MAIPGNANLLLLTEAAGAAPTGYSIDRSIRLNSADTAYLSRTPSSAGNRKTWTWAGWVKRSKLNNQARLFNADITNTDRIEFQLHNETENYLRLELKNDSGVNGNFVTSQVFRDTSSWYHIVLALDTTQATSSDRVKIYVNGVRVTSFSAETYPDQNEEYAVNATTIHSIGRSFRYDRHFDGYLADIHFIDGQALDPTSFGEFDDNGVWQPIEYAGTYGTNGFHLDFSDATSTTTIAEDSSGNNNDWTANNISVTAGAGNDSLFDSPTNANADSDTGAGGEVSGNYCCWNAVDRTVSSPIPLANGNLDVSGTGSGSEWSPVNGTIGMSSGKWYWEITCAGTVYSFIGIAQVLPQDGTGERWPGRTATSYGYYNSSGDKYNNNTSSAYGASYGSTDVIGVAFDADSGTLTYYKNGTSQGTAFSSIPSGTYFPCISNFYTSATQSANFGQRPFAYPVSGYQPLTTALFDDPTIADGSTAMDVALYTGNGSTQTISGLGFSPDLVYIKSRTSAYSPNMADTVRGVNKLLYTDGTDAESTNSNDVYAFTSDGFSVGSNLRVNASSNAMVAWTWDGGSSTVSNTDGSITSSVRANASAGFSIVGYTGTGSNATVGHGLGVAPEFGIVKMRTDAGFDWCVYHSGLTSPAYALALHTTGAQGNEPATWNSTAPTSSVFSIGTRGSVNTSSKDFIAYWWTPVEGYSAFGSYTGSSGLPFVYLGFRPQLIMIKNTTTASTNWRMIDATRDGYNDGSGAYWLKANSSNAEVDERPVDLLSNGFKLRMTDPGDLNYSTDTYIYCAWAENPFKTSRAR